MRKRLQTWNARITGRIPPWVVAVAAGLVCSVLFLTYYSVRFGLNVPPSASGDEPSYDSLGWELSRGRGFQLNFEDPPFRAPYDRQAAAGEERFALPHMPPGPIAYRPPLFPMLLAGLDDVWGRQFAGVRILNVLAMALVCGGIAAAVHARWGAFPAGVSVLLFVVVDYRTRLYGRAILTEALSAALVAGLCGALWQAQRSGRRGCFVAAGLLCGAAILARSMIALWTPVLAIGVVGMSRRRDGTSWRDALVAGATFLAATVLTVAPWAARNVAVLGRFMPLGTQGMMELAAGYSEFAWDNAGVWQRLDNQGVFDEALAADPQFLERELALADASRSLALQWIRDNPGRALALAPLKVLQELRPRSAGEAILLVLAVVGVWATWRRPEIQVLLLVIAADLAAVAVTWSVEGRFLVPLLFAEHILAAAGAWRLLAGDIDASTSPSATPRLSTETTTP